MYEMYMLLEFREKSRIRMALSKEEGKGQGGEKKDEDGASSQGDGEAPEISGNMATWVGGMQNNKEFKDQQ